MASPLLGTRRYVPRGRRDLVPRPRLSAHLDAGADAKLTLVTPPAGFGKTTLLAEWLAAARPSGSTRAWLSLDQSDNDPATFWSYVIAARADPPLPLARMRARGELVEVRTADR